MNWYRFALLGVLIGGWMPVARMMAGAWLVLVGVGILFLIVAVEVYHRRGNVTALRDMALTSHGPRPLATVMNLQVLVAFAMRGAVEPFAAWAAAVIVQPFALWIVRQRAEEAWLALSAETQTHEDAP